MHLNALESLQLETQKKLMQLVSEQHEIKRQYEELEFSEAFLKFQEEKLDPIDYLKGWA